MDANTVGWVITVAVFGTVGWCLGLRRTRPAGVGTYLALALLCVAGFFIGRHTRLLSILGAGIYLNWVLVAFGVGALGGVLIRGLRAGRAVRA